MKASEIKTLIMLEIIAPSNNDYDGNRTVLSKEERDYIHDAYKAQKSWEDVFSIIKDEQIKVKYTELFNELDKKEKEELT